MHGHCEQGTQSNRLVALVTYSKRKRKETRRRSGGNENENELEGHIIYREYSPTLEVTANRASPELVFMMLMSEKERKGAERSHE